MKNIKLVEYISPAQQGTHFRRALRYAKSSLRELVDTDPKKLSREGRSLRAEEIPKAAVNVMALQEVLRKIKVKDWSTSHDPLGERVSRENSRIASEVLKKWGAEFE